MSNDLEVLSYLTNTLEEVVLKLEKSVQNNKLDETNKLKKTISEITKKISEELK